MSPLNYLTEYLNELIGKVVLLIIGGTGIVLVITVLIRTVKNSDALVRFINYFFGNQ